MPRFNMSEEDAQVLVNYFAAVDRLWGEGLECVKVAVGGPETPAALVAAADVVVDGPQGLVALLRELLPSG